jgi:hypothetical protein
MPQSGALQLKDYPADMVRLACTRCDRKGQYRKATPIKQHGAETTLPDLRTRIAQCDFAQTASTLACRGVYPAYSDPCPQRSHRQARSAARGLAYFRAIPGLTNFRPGASRSAGCTLTIARTTANAKPAINRPNTMGRSSGFIQARHPNGSVCAKRITTVRECSHRTQGLPPWQERARRCDQPGPNNRVLRGLTKGTRSCK